MKTKKIGWKVCYVNDVADSYGNYPNAFALVKLEIDPDNIISDPSIRIGHGGTDPFTLHALDNFNQMMGLIMNFLKGACICDCNGRSPSIFSLACDTYIGEVLHGMKCRATKAKVLEFYPFNKRVTVIYARSIYEPPLFTQKMSMYPQRI